MNPQVTAWAFGIQQFATVADTYGSAILIGGSLKLVGNALVVTGVGGPQTKAEGRVRRPGTAGCCPFP